MTKLYYNTVSPLLVDILRNCMAGGPLNSFRLAGGTALSLQRGHRQSDDIDLFTDSPYQTIDFEAIDYWIKSNFHYVQSSGILPVGIGKPYFIGNNQTECIKVDLYYTDAFIDDFCETDGIRLASIREIIAMKIDVIMRGGRKKDFWDIHELIEDYSLDEMLDFHKKRYPYMHERDLILHHLTNPDQTDADFEPRCLRGKHWELIKLDLLRKMNT